MVVAALANILERLIEINMKNGHVDRELSVFHSLYAPGVSIFHYLDRIRAHANADESVFVLALVYMDRLTDPSTFTSSSSPKIVLSNLNVHRIFLAAFVVSIKFHQDYFYKNSYYAKLGGLPVWELNCLELSFLKGVNFGLLVEPAEYERYHAELMFRMRSIRVCHIAPVFQMAAMPSVEMATFSPPVAMFSSHMVVSQAAPATTQESESGQTTPGSPSTVSSMSPPPIRNSVESDPSASIGSKSHHKEDGHKYQYRRQHHHQQQPQQQQHCPNPYPECNGSNNSTNHNRPLTQSEKRQRRQKQKQNQNHALRQLCPPPLPSPPGHKVADITVLHRNYTPENCNDNYSYPASSASSVPRVYAFTHPLPEGTRIVLPGYGSNGGMALLVPVPHLPR